MTLYARIGSQLRTCVAFDSSALVAFSVRLHAETVSVLVLIARGHSIPVFACRV
jgi:hypothetical protein